MSSSFIFFSIVLASILPQCCNACVFTGCDCNSDCTVSTPLTIIKNTPITVFNGNLTISSGSTLQFELPGALLQVTGNVKMEPETKLHFKNSEYIRYSANASEIIVITTTNGEIEQDVLPSDISVNMTNTKCGRASLSVLLYTNVLSTIMHCNDAVSTINVTTTTVISNMNITKTPDFENGTVGKTTPFILTSPMLIFLVLLLLLLH